MTRGAETRADEEARAVTQPPEEQIKPAAKEENAIVPPPEPVVESVLSLAAASEVASQEEAEARPMPMASPADPAVKIEGDEITVTIGPRTYQVLGLEKNTSRAVMRVNVRVSGRNLRGESGYHGDTLDMELARQRASFIKQASHELGREGRDDPSRGGQGVDGAGRVAA